MATFAEVYFDIKCLGLLANQDAGVKVNGNSFAPCNIEYLTSSGMAIRVDTSRITTYGGGAFKTGICCGLLILKGFSNSSFESPIFLSPTHFDEIKVGNNSFFRFNFIKQENVSGFIVSPLNF